MRDSLKRNDDEIAIKLTNVSKRYIIHHEKPTLVEKIIKTKNEEFWALRDINLTIGKGERIGLIGLNGSGKTTLLKTIVGITTPTAGNVSRAGHIVSLIDPEAGFHPELTGEQNIYLNGMLLGLSKNDISRVFNDIVKFADIKQFIDAPLFTYSSGMKLRLGFSIAIHSKPSALIIDEMFLIGDNIFQKKSLQKIHELFQKNMTFIIASHIPSFISNNCHTCLWLENGKIVKNGPPDKVINAYLKIRRGLSNKQHFNKDQPR